MYGTEYYDQIKLNLCELDEMDYLNEPAPIQTKVNDDHIQFLLLET